MNELQRQKAIEALEKQKASITKETKVYQYK